MKITLLLAIAFLLQSCVIIPPRGFKRGWNGGNHARGWGGNAPRYRHNYRR